MKVWELVCSKTGESVDYVATLYKDTEPDFWTCYDIAAAHGCDFFTVQETAPGPADPNDECTGCRYLNQCRSGANTQCILSSFHCVINGRVCIEVSKTYPGAFYHCGAWYIYEK